MVALTLPSLCATPTSVLCYDGTMIWTGVRVRRKLTLLMLAVIAVGASAFLPNTIRTRDDLSEIRSGLPIPYLVQDGSRLSYGASTESPPLPRTITLLSPLEFPTKTILWAFLLNVLATWALLEVLWHLAGTLRTRVGSKETSA